MANWGSLGLYAATAASIGCVRFHFDLKRRQRAAPATLATPPSQGAEDDPENMRLVVNNERHIADEDPMILPALRLSSVAKFAAGTTFVSSAALLAYKQTKSVTEAAGWALGSALLLPLNYTGIEVMPPDALNIHIPITFRKLGSFLFMCSVSAISLITLRRLYSDATSFLLVNALGLIPLGLEVGDWGIRHRKRVQARFNAAVSRWSQGGAATFLDQYLNTLISGILLFRAENDTFSSTAVRAVCVQHHNDHAQALRQSIKQDLESEGLPANVSSVAAHAVERLIGAIVRSSRAVSCLQNGFSAGEHGSSDSEITAVRSQLRQVVFNDISQEAANALKFAGFFRSALGML